MSSKFRRQGEVGGGGGLFEGVATNSRGGTLIPVCGRAYSRGAGAYSRGRGLIRGGGGGGSLF